MSMFDEEILQHLLVQAKSLAPLLTDSMEQTFADQSHYTWEALVPIRQAISHLCQQINEQTYHIAVTISRERQLFSSIDNRQEFTKNMQILKRDLVEYSHRLMEIQQKHQNMTGVVKGSAQIASFVGIWESYIEWMQSYTDVVIPLFGSVCQDVIDAERTMSYNNPHQ